MLSEYVKYLSNAIPKKDSLALVRKETEKFFKTYPIEKSYEAIMPLYASDNFQIQEVGVFLCGYIGNKFPDTIVFLRDSVSQHKNWKVQETLAMAFDIHCKSIGYENALPLIKEWLSSDSANVRRAVSEGLRIWTSRPYFKEYPEVAINLLAALRYDESDYVRKSVGNALRDISKKHPKLICDELNTWELSTQQELQVYNLASKLVEKQKNMPISLL